MMMYNSQLFRSSEVDSPGIRMIREEAEGREAEGEDEERDG